MLSFLVEYLMYLCIMSSGIMLVEGALSSNPGTFFDLPYPNKVLKGLSSLWTLKTLDFSLSIFSFRMILWIRSAW